jgi:transglutaminase-like putative cysteine protease
VALLGATCTRSHQEGFMSRAHCQIHASSVFPLVRWLLIAGLAALAAGVGPLAAAETPEPWEEGAFAADPAAVIEAASRIGASAGEDRVIVLFAETRLRFEEDGRMTRVKRMLYRIQHAEVDASWSALEKFWAPWYQERPELRARVITPDGAVHTLDPATVAEASMAPEPNLFEDGRILRAPLPAIGPGAVVEQEVTVRDTAPFFDAGMVETVWMRGGVPVRHAIVAVEAPAGLPLRHVVRHLPEGGFRDETVDGRRRLLFEYRDLSPYGEIEPHQPLDLWASYIELSTGASWADVARRYAEIIEEAARGAERAPEIQEFLRSASVPAASRRETIDRLLARMGKEIRYTGVELGAGGIIPRSPVDTLRRKFGDCKDKAVLLTVLLRALDIPAQVALLSAGEDQGASRNRWRGWGLSTTRSSWSPARRRSGSIRPTVMRGPVSCRPATRGGRR